MLFFSPYAAYRVGIRSQMDIRNEATGVIIRTIPALRAEFAQQLGTEYQVKDPLTNLMTTQAHIVGHYFDSDVAAEQNRWTDDEKDAVENRLLEQCRIRPDQIRHVEFKAPIVLPPWPTYDQADAEEAVDLANTLGLAAEALAYERTKDARPDVIYALEAVTEPKLDDNGDEIPAAPLRNLVEQEKEVFTPARGGEPRDATGAHQVPGVLVV